jgi:hypothetical protein
MDPVSLVARPFSRPRRAALFASLCGLMLAGCAAAPPPPGYGPPPGYAPPSYTPPAGYAPPSGYGAPAGYNPGPAAYAPAPTRSFTRAQFVAMFRRMAERRGGDPERAAGVANRRFDMIDTDHDGIIQPYELQAWRAAHGRQAGQQPPPGGQGTYQAPPQGAYPGPGSYQGAPPQQWQSPPPQE